MKDVGHGLVATSPTKNQHSGALNLILQRAKERRAAAIKQQPITVSESTADLVLNMEETSTNRVDTPDLEKVQIENNKIKFLIKIFIFIFISIKQNLHIISKIYDINLYLGAHTKWMFFMFR